MIWFAVFHPKERRHWWARRFSHVSLAGFSNETWLHLDLGRDGVDTRMFFAYDDVQGYLSYLTAHHVVLKVETGHHRYFFRPMNCVSFTKHTLGLRSRALLPDQLFQSLTREHNAVMMNETQGPRGNSGTEGSSPTL